MMSVINRSVAEMAVGGEDRNAQRFLRMNEYYVGYKEKAAVVIESDVRPFILLTLDMFFFMRLRIEIEWRRMSHRWPRT